MLELAEINDLVLLFLLSIIVSLVCNKVKLTPTVGFLLTGFLCGPSVMNVITDQESISTIADLGVAMLLFTIGMELSGEALNRLKKPVFLGGSLQIGCTVGAVAVLMHFQGAAWTQGIIWGCLLSIFTMKKYSSKLAIGRTTSRNGGGFASIAMTAMMIGLCSTFVGSYLSQALRATTFVPFLTALVSALFMALFDALSRRRSLQFLDSFSLALSMLAGMIGSIIFTAGGIR